MKYPAAIVTDDGWGLIFRGHDLDPAVIEAEMATEGYVSPFQVEELHFIYCPRVKWCDRHDGFGCDNVGDWHAHWFAVKPSNDLATKFTVVHEARIDGAA